MATQLQTLRKLRAKYARKQAKAAKLAAKKKVKAEITSLRRKLKGR